MRRAIIAVGAVVLVLAGAMPTFADHGDVCYAVGAYGNVQHGTTNNDTMYGDHNADGDCIDPRNGNDVVWLDDGGGTAGAFRDFVIASQGSDTLHGQGGRDWLEGGADNDTLKGGVGDDVLDGGGQSDAVYDGLGEDWAQGGGGFDIYYNCVGQGETPDMFPPEGFEQIYTDNSYC